MAVAYAIFMEKKNDIVVNMDAIISYKTSSSALIMALNKSGVNLMDVPSEQLRAIAKDMVEVVINAPSLDVTDP